MKIVSARIRNFKLLRSIDLYFSIDRDRPLTVIRAENGSGKTSTLQAMRWALYGKDVLDDPLIRISPADWPDGEDCPVSVVIDFVHSTVSNIDGQPMVSEVSYLLKREVVENPQGNKPNRGQERITLYEKNAGGADPITGAESRLAQMLPKEMIDIFFTDGDAAMTFISPQLSDDTKRDKVREAIRSLLGLDLLDRVKKRVGDAQSAVTRKIANDTSSEQLSKVSKMLLDATEKRDKTAEKVASLNEQIKGVNRNLEQVSRDLTRALESGSYEQLAHQRETYKEQLALAAEEENQHKRAHQELFLRESLSWDLIGPQLRKGFDLLESLHAKGIIPRAAVPILEERLELAKCICGTELVEGSKARQEVMALIEQQRDNDGQVDYLSSLYYQGKAEIAKRSAPDAETWKDEVNRVQKLRVTLTKRIEDANREFKSVEAKLDQIDEEAIQEKKRFENSLRASLRLKNTELDRSHDDLRDLEEESADLKKRQTELSRADKKMDRLNAEKAVLNDLDCVVAGALEEMQGVYLNRVSTRMNELFLDMVGADPEQNTVFQGAEISSNYSIVVRTTDNRTLNPDFEVNGASQRALTFAFIWALTEVSGVVAPRVVDTPLGMMSGNVKRRVLKMVSSAAGDEVDRQVILFLTQSEISHTEDILDSHTGMCSTLIKTDDYPADLVNNPEVERSEVRQCACSHREYCEQCQRSNYEDFNLSYRTA